MRAKRRRQVFSPPSQHSIRTRCRTYPASRLTARPPSRGKDRADGDSEQSQRGRLGYFRDYYVVVEEEGVWARKRCKRVGHAERDRSAILRLRGIDYRINLRIVRVTRVFHIPLYQSCGHVTGQADIHPTVENITRE